MILYLHQVPNRTKQLIEEVVERRHTTHPFTFEIDTFLEVHRMYRLEVQLAQNIIKITVDPGEPDQAYYDFVLNSLISKI